ncbi:MAG: hypothetical protein L0271_17725 [Gemmatimonadetes bacterium]|nr:hypothetical protein [Gemmatimonadota bacterium]
MSGLAPVIGHDEARRVLAQALAGGVLPASILLHGPAGIGKQRLALWLAQLILCDRPGATGPCGTCRACRLSLRLEHPDQHWFFPLPRPKGASADRLGDALEEARATELEARRADPWYASASVELTGIYLAHAHVIRRLAVSRPAMAQRRAFIIGDADLLVSQEASPEAANALLKLLEEPPSDTTLILTSSEPDALLPTIRSRLTAFRLSPLPAPEVADVLCTVRRIDRDQAALIARLAAGSIGHALAFVGPDGSPGPFEDARNEAREWLEVACDAQSARRYETALAQAPAGARAGFSVTLRFFILWLRDLAAVANGAEDLVINTDAIEPLRNWSRSCAAAATGSATAIQDAEATLQLTQWNVNPQLALVSLLRTVAARLSGDYAGLAAGAAPAWSP